MKEPNIKSAILKAAPKSGTCAKTRALILRLLVEGNSIRATTRIADVSKNTVTHI